MEDHDYCLDPNCPCGQDLAEVYPNLFQDIPDDILKELAEDGTK